MSLPSLVRTAVVPQRPSDGPPGGFYLAARRGAFPRVALGTGLTPTADHSKRYLRDGFQAQEL